MFRFDGKTYGEKEAYLDAYIVEDGPSLVWGFELSGEREITGEEDSGPAYVKASIQECPAFVSRVGSIKKWQEVAGTKVELKAQYEEDPEVMVYLGEHVGLTRGYFEIYSDSSKLLRIKLCGVCDSLHGQAKKLEIDTSVDFKGVLSGRRSKKEAMSSLKRILDARDFIYHQNEHGVAVCVPKES